MENKLGIVVQERNQRIGIPRVRVGPKQHCEHDPAVRIQRDGNRIESIVISCRCGEEITVICDYDENTK